MKSAMAIVFVALIAFACDKNTVEPTVDLTQNQQSIAQVMDMNSRIQTVRGFSFSSSPIGGRAFLEMTNQGSNDFNFARSSSDSTDHSGDDPHEGCGEYETCAEITETMNPDGSYTLVIDYGDEGCEEDGELIKGKITINSGEKGNAYWFEEIFEDYSFDGIVLNGTSSSEYQWSEDSLEANTGTMTEDMMVYIEEDDEEFTYKSNFEFEEDLEFFKITKGDFEGSSSNGDTFKSTVVTPLVEDFKCEDTDIFVSGIEQMTYNEDEITIDYGDGTCDNIITVTENGETYTIDLDEDDES